MPSTSRARGTYARTAARRQEILEAAFEVFAEKGYESGSVRDIAERVGITHTAVLFHFKSKVDLLGAVLEERDARSRGRFVKEGETDLEQLMAFIDLLQDNLEDPGMTELYTVLSAEATSETHPAHQYFLNRYEWIIDQARTTLTAMKADGVLREEVDPEYAATTLIALADGLQVQWLYKRTSQATIMHLRSFVQSLITEPLDAALAGRVPLESSKS